MPNGPYICSVPKAWSPDGVFKAQASVVQMHPIISPTSRFHVALLRFIIPVLALTGTALAGVRATALSMAQAHTITLRSLEATWSSSDDSFVFDGSHSDIAQQLYRRHKAGDTDDQVSLNAVPAAVVTRLRDLDITFSDLPGLVQRAVLWDTGFGISPSNDPVQIWTTDDYTMADIAVPKDEVSAEGCTFKNCTQPNDELAYYTLICSGAQMVNVSRCVADTFVDSAAASYLGSMWSVGGDPDMTPQIRLRDHSWVDPVTEVAYSVYAVHTTSVADDPAWNVCPADDGYGALTVPCHRRDEFTDDELAAMNTPTGSAWVTTWLGEEFSEGSGSGFDLLLLLPIIVGVLVLIAAIGGGWFYWKRRATDKINDTVSSTCDLAGPSPQYVSGGTVPLPKYGSGTPDQAPRPTILTTRESFLFKTQAGVYESAGSCRTLKILLGSQHLVDKRMPYESITCQRALCKGSSGEVWVCEHNGQQVAVKRLLQTREQKAEHVQAFAEEIELTASLDHPNIVGFIGVAWNTLNNLVMVLDYVPMGSLQRYLHQNADLLSWARDKIHMAVGIAQALGYLHGHTPSLIHRDLKSNNILLTHMLEPILIDFGVSRGTVELTMTAGVGTPYWTAPEILEGKRYTEQADIYSFGVVLSELDTGKIPYHDALTENGGKVKPVQILQDVVSGTLRPSFSEDCPPRIRRIGSACLAQDPSSRPTAQQLIKDLEGKESKGGEVYAM
ncbi:hypothetical protein PHYPSEUDO_002198 [Phytophthora pseudosyringae]|uniref:Protein kinase domain-containing protein n=1 Tax=Phytophthora pseudosyringae TaxID=221518 RepID=A0A8T1VTP3_9STRA|nr:hypothetical protein PHYPSEUDO_002198 [Phytophthora pseudosyringae]